jgi:simple sugar transport system permease protein
MTKQFKILYRTVLILLAVAAAMLAGALILWTIGADVTKTYSVIIFEPLKNKIQIGEVIIRAIPLTVIALGLSVAYRSGIINIGAEGQMAMGIIAATAVALAFPGLPKAVLLPLALTAGAIGGAAWGFIPGLLKAKLHVSELLSTVMLNYIAAQFYPSVSGPMLDPAEITMGSGTPSRCVSRRRSGSTGWFRAHESTRASI